METHYAGCVLRVLSRPNRLTSSSAGVKTCWLLRILKQVFLVVQQPTVVLMRQTRLNKWIKSVVILSQAAQQRMHTRHRATSANREAAARCVCVGTV